MKQAALKRRQGLHPGCGRYRYDDAIAAGLALAGPGRADSSRHENGPARQARYHAACGGWHLYPAPAGRSPGKAALTASAPPGTVRPAGRKAPRDTGFPAAVRLLIRTRAGNGDPQNARCEACGVWLGEHGGQIQHIYARGAGGSAGRLYRSAANGCLLCGTSATGCHGLCENRDPHMFEKGFWRRRNGQEQPGGYPVTLHGHGGGTIAWLTPGGRYAAAAPGEGAALTMSYAQGEFRRQKRRPAWRVLATLPTFICLPAALGLLLALAVMLAVCLLLHAAIEGGRQAWRWARGSRELDEYAAEMEFTLRDIPQDSKDRFRDQLRMLCADMAQAAARADLDRTGEGTPP